MSRKSIISFVALAAFAAATLASAPASAHKNGGPGKGPGGKGPGNHWVWKHHDHFVHFHDRIYVRPVAYTVRESTPGPCTCLWKGYTPEGTVVFKDLCTQEMASAPVEGAPAQASEVQAPGNFAGKSYKDYLAANPQAQKN